MLHIAVDTNLYHKILYIINTDERLDGHVLLVRGAENTYDADLIISQSGIEFPFSWNHNKAPFLFTEPLPAYPQYILAVTHFLLGNYKTSSSILDEYDLFTFESNIVAHLIDRKKISWNAFKRIVQLEEDTPEEVFRTQHNAAITLHYGKVDVKNDPALKKYYYERAIQLAPHGILKAYTSYYFIHFLKSIGDYKSIDAVKDSVLNDKTVPNSIKERFVNPSFILSVAS